MKKRILLVAAARTGSSRFLQLCDSFDDLMSLGEFFNWRSEQKGKDNNQVLSKLNFETNDLGTPEKLKSRVYCAKNPLQSINDAWLHTTNTHLIVKVGPGHINPHNLPSFVNDFFDAAIILKRRPIDSFISKQKAAMTKTWGHVDTTELHVSLKVDSYINYLKKFAMHYSMYETLLKNTRTPHLTLHYEDFITHSTAVAHLGIQKEFEKFGIVLSNPHYDGLTLTKQDKSLRYEDKVCNWEEFLIKLAAIDLRLLNTLPKMKNKTRR